ncbi:MAG TPA: DUF4007 family protein [Roseiflexaceae bacterium]|nr:DUF4007 family protein [Roseiflexaceae bacterium]HMP39187.1 DUF4007 family protein [Roseiflexaceae bacterium]
MAVNPLSPASFSFSGHETFVLRSNWLKKAYDLLREQPDLFFREDAFVRLGVGKNMANAIRFWGRVCHIFERSDTPSAHRATWLGDKLFNDEDGWDPFLVTPASRWLLHFQIVSRTDAAFTWYYTFNLLRRGEFTVDQLSRNIVSIVAQHDGRAPSEATLKRDIDCMLRCYVRPDTTHLSAAEDALHCPLNELGVIQPLPGQSSYRLVNGARPDLPDHLVIFAALQQARTLGRSTVAFNELAYGERSPGRIFRLDEDALLMRLFHFETITNGRASYTESGGIRQIVWHMPEDEKLDQKLLEAAFAQERHHV